MVFFGSELGLLDGVDGLINDVRRVLGNTQSDREERLVDFVDLLVDLGDVRLVFFLEPVDGIDQALLFLGFRHEFNSINARPWVKSGFLLDHKFVDQVDKNQTIRT